MALKNRLDVEMLKRGVVTSRSQADSWIKLGRVFVDGKKIDKSGYFVSDKSKIELRTDERYVSRAGLKLASVAKVLKLNFRDKLVMDVGSSTGGFTDYSLQKGARKVYAIDVGTDQLHPSLCHNNRIDLHEKTDIRDFYVDEKPEIILIDVSFISLRDILPHIAKKLSDKNTQIVAMVKPQFEAGKGQTNKGIIKNDSQRRQILRDFEDWSKKYFVIVSKRDSDVAGAKGNQERFYLMRLLNK